MNTRILIISPFEDIQTSLSLRAAYNLRDWAELRGIEVKMLDGLEANRLFLKLAIADDMPLICYFGHADEDEIFGQDPLRSMIDKSNVEIFKDKIFYSMSCLSANEIGSTIIDNGAKAFFGSYTNMYATFNDGSHNFEKDWIDIMTIIPKSLLLGKTCEKALIDYNIKCENYIKEYSKNIEVWPNAEQAIGNTRLNVNNFTLLGDLQTKINIRHGTYKNKIYDLLWKVRPIVLGLVGIGTLLSISKGDKKRQINK